MNPTNKRTPLILPDGETVRCRFMAQADAPIFWEECETLATELAGFSVADWYHYLYLHPKATVGIRAADYIYLCDTHGETMKGLIS